MAKKRIMELECMSVKHPVLKNTEKKGRKKKKKMIIQAL